jgi:hypothetical protein
VFCHTTQQVNSALNVKTCIEWLTNVGALLRYWQTNCGGRCAGNWVAFLTIEKDVLERNVGIFQVIAETNSHWYAELEISLSKDLRISSPTTKSSAARRLCKCWWPKHASSVVMNGLLNKGCTFCVTLFPGNRVLVRKETGCFPIMLCPKNKLGYVMVFWTRDLEVPSSPDIEATVFHRNLWRNIQGGSKSKYSNFWFLLKDFHGCWVMMAVYWAGASSVRGRRRLTAWAMAQPYSLFQPVRRIMVLRYREALPAAPFSDRVYYPPLLWRL